MNTFELVHHRLCNQGISCNTFSRPDEVVARFGALQAQDRPSSLWAIGLRAPSSSAEDIEKAIVDGRIVRTWLLRGTLHFTAAEDVRWMLRLLSPRLIAGSKRRDDQLALDGQVYARARGLLSDVLQGGEPLARQELMGVLEKAGISTAGQRGYHILWHLALTGLICFGPMKGRQPTFALLDEWSPHGKELTRDGSLEELASRYFTGHGPAQLPDLIWWSGLSASDARAGLELAKPGLVEATFGGATYWSRPSEHQNAEEFGGLQLLPGFDEYIIGYRDRSAVLDRRHTKKVLSSNGIFHPTLVIDGRARGSWKAVRKRKEIIIEASPFSALSKEEIRSLEAAGARYGRFLGLPATMCVGEVSTGEPASSRAASVPPATI